MKCYRCEDIINDKNVSEEHIILNACGGRLKSKSLLCKKCNSIFGDKFDCELAKTTNDIANLLMIKRHDGIPQPISTTRTSTGEKYYLEYGGSPVQAKTNYKIIPEDSTKSRLMIDAKNRKELKKTLIGLKRKYPTIEVEKILDAAEERRFYINDSFEINSHIGGNDVFKSITKTAINFYIHQGGSRAYIKHLLPYLEGNIELDIVWMHYPDKDIYTPAKDEVSHVLKIVGDSKEKILYAYVELFNLHSFIIYLNESYDGVDIDNDYIFNVHNYEVTKKRTHIRLSRAGLTDLFTNKDAKPFEKVKKRYARILTIANKQQDKHQIHKIISNAIDNSLGLLPEGTVIDEKVLNSMINKLMERMMPFIAHRNNIKNIN